MSMNKPIFYLVICAAPPAQDIDEWPDSPRGGADEVSGLCECVRAALANETRQRL